MLDPERDAARRQTKAGLAPKCEADPALWNLLSTLAAVVVIVVFIAVMAIPPVPILSLFVLVAAVVVLMPAMRVGFPLVVIHAFVMIPSMVIMAIVVVDARGAPGYDCGRNQNST